MDLRSAAANVASLRHFLTLNHVEAGIRRGFRRWADLLPLIQHRWDVVHLMNWPLYGLLRTYLSASDVKWVLSFRGYETLYGAAENAEWRRFLGELWEGASVLRFVSAFLANKGIELGAPRFKIAMIRPSVDVEVFRPIMQRAREGVCRIASVCRLTWEKGLEMGMMVVKRLRGRGVPVIYHVVGDGPSQTAIRCWAEKAGIDDCVRWHGGVASSEVRGILGRCAVYLHP